MAFEPLKKALGNVRFSVDKAQAANVLLADANNKALDFQASRRAQIAKEVIASVAALDKEAKALQLLADKDSESEMRVIGMIKVLRGMKDAKDMIGIRDGAHLLRNELSDLEAQANEKISPIPTTVPVLPQEIRLDIQSDLAEIRRCFDAECYRSVVILCGRVLEVALHRKYFDATGNDLMEKAPGTGLGNLIKKLAEHSVVVDPGLTNQIHLINQVRVNSVHVKKDAFSPTKDQAHAMALYTIDAIRKLFENRGFNSRP
jgi:phosphopantetheine adenylyltransferase